MPKCPTPELRLRLGCPLALLLTAILAAAVESLVYGRAIRADEEAVLLGAFIGLPFGILALAGARDWLAWLIAVGLNAGLWTYIFYADRQSTDFMWGFTMMLIPLAIAGACLAVAGMRGRIGWARGER